MFSAHNPVSVVHARKKEAGIYAVYLLFVDLSVCLDQPEIPDRVVLQFPLFPSRSCKGIEILTFPLIVDMHRAVEVSDKVDDRLFEVPADYAMMEM